MLKEVPDIGEKELIDRHTFEPMREYEIIEQRYGSVSTDYIAGQLKYRSVMSYSQALVDLDQCLHLA